jgi:hypothetical protein
MAVRGAIATGTMPQRAGYDRINAPSCRLETGPADQLELMRRAWTRSAGASGASGALRALGGELAGDGGYGLRQVGRGGGAAGVDQPPDQDAADQVPGYLSTRTAVAITLPGYPEFPDPGPGSR